jgi:hypothetical protein
MIPGVYDGEGTARLCKVRYGSGCALSGSDGDVQEPLSGSAKF